MKSRSLAALGALSAMFQLPEPDPDRPIAYTRPVGTPGIAKLRELRKRKRKARVKQHRHMANFRRGR